MPQQCCILASKDVTWGTVHTVPLVKISQALWARTPAPSVQIDAAPGLTVRRPHRSHPADVPVLGGAIRLDATYGLSGRQPRRLGVNAMAKKSVKLASKAAKRVAAKAAKPRKTAPKSQ